MSDIEKVKKLKNNWCRFQSCNSALKESNGDLDKASEILVKVLLKHQKKCQEMQKKE